MNQSDHPDAQWFPDAGLGLFVHWGIASAHSDVKLSWGMVEDHNSPTDAVVSPEEYYNLAETFDPGDYEPDRWLSAAREAGMEYALLTAIHHDGFTLWPSEHSDFGVHAYLDGRDPLGEYVDACRRQGLKVGFYSHPNSGSTSTIRPRRSVGGTRSDRSHRRRCCRGRDWRRRQTGRRDGPGRCWRGFSR